MGCPRSYRGMPERCRAEAAMAHRLSRACVCCRWSRSVSPHAFAIPTLTHLTKTNTSSRLQRCTPSTWHEKKRCAKAYSCCIRARASVNSTVRRGLTHSWCGAQITHATAQHPIICRPHKQARVLLIRADLTVYLVLIHICGLLSFLLLRVILRLCFVFSLAISPEKL